MPHINEKGNDSRKEEHTGIERGGYKLKEKSEASKGENRERLEKE